MLNIKKYLEELLMKINLEFSHTIEIEPEILLFIKHARNLEICIGTNEIIINAYEPMPSLKESTYKSIHNYATGFYNDIDLLLEQLHI